MPLPPPSTRRDPRYDLLPGTSSVEFDDPGAPGRRLRGVLTKVSVSGIGIQCDDPEVRLDPDTRIPGAHLRIGDCRLRGDLTIRNVRPSEQEDRVEFGALFYPATGIDERLWMALLAGITAAVGV